MENPLAVLAELVALPGPPGQEGAVRACLAAHLDRLGIAHRTDRKGNLLVGAERPETLVTAHLDEIALLVRHVEDDGRLRVAPLGGSHPWKWGEAPVDILSGEGRIPGILSFGSVHTTDPTSNIQLSRDGRALGWGDTWVATGLSAREAARAGIRPGVRVVLAGSRRGVHALRGDLISAPFLDDRGDLLAWLLALERLAEDGGPPEGVCFAATVSEEVGGHGALYLARRAPAETVVALEIGPNVPDCPVVVDARPVVWVSDGYAATDPADLARLAPLEPQWLALSRGGSDASIAASLGLCASAYTFAFAVDNSHGQEIAHRDSFVALADFLVRSLPLIS